MDNVVAQPNLQIGPLLFRLRTALAILAYIALLVVTYLIFISPYYAYAQLTLTMPEPFEFLVMVLLAVLPVFFMPTSLQRPSSIIIWSCYLVVYVPVAFLPTITGSVLFPMQVLNTSVILLSLAILAFFLKLPLVEFAYFKLSPRFVRNTLLLVYSLILALLFVKFRRFMGFVNFSNVYSHRGFFANHSGASLLYYYPLQWVGRTLAPLFIAYGIIYKKKVFWILGFVGALMIYLIAAYKTVLLISLAIPLVIFYLRVTSCKLGAFILSVLIAVGLCLIIDLLFPYHVFKHFLLTQLLTRRILIVPGFLTGKYWQFFIHHPYTFFTNSIFKHFFLNTYPKGVSYTVGYWLYSKKIDLNVNMFASAYAAFGNLGVIVISLLLSVYLWAYDSLTQHFDRTFALTLAFVIALSLTQSSFTVTLFTGGALLILLALYFCKGILEHET